jgi:hypothetical protein
MSTYEREARIREKFESKMQKISRKLEDLQTDEDVHRALDEVDAELDVIDEELAAMGVAGVETPGLRERIEAKRERLLAKQERLRMKADLRQDLRTRLEESLGEMETQLEETLRTVRAQHEHAAHSATWQPRYSPSQPAGPAVRHLQDERRKILEMVQGGTISADDAAQLLDALRDQEESTRRPRRRPRWVRIRVTDTNADKVRVNLTLPVGLVRAGLRAGGSIAGVEGLNTSELEEMLDRGEIGHILDLHDSNDGERIEIFVE